MDDVRSTLEQVQRQVHARPDALEQVRRRHAGRRRRRRATVASLQVLAIAVVATVSAFAVGRLDLAPPSTGSVIDVSTVDRLAPAWRVQLDGAGSPRATLSGDMVYVAGDDGVLRAIDARSGATEWLGSTTPGTPTNPVVAEGTILLHIGGHLYAFDVGCASDGSTCAPRWVARTGGPNEATPTVVDGIAYVVAAPGGVIAFPLDCAVDCRPLWTAPDPGSHVAHAAAVSEGVVWDTSTHALAALPARCETATCDPLVSGVSPNGADLVSGPTVANGVIYVGASDGGLYAVSTACAGGGSCDARWVGRTGGSIVGTPLVTRDRVFVASSDGAVYAFATACGGGDHTCAPLWVGRTNGPLKEQPLAAGGLVFVASTDGDMYAFPEACAADGSECAPASVRAVGPLPASPVSWADRALLTVAADGVLTQWTVDGRPQAAAS